MPKDQVPGISGSQVVDSHALWWIPTVSAAVVESMRSPDCSSSSARFL